MCSANSDVGTLREWGTSGEPRLSIRRLLAERVAAAPDAVVLSAPGREPLTYKGLAQQIDQIVAGLTGLGVGRADRVAIALGNGPEMATTFLATATAATAAPLNPNYTASEFEFYLSDIAARAVIVETGVDSPVRTVARALGIAVLEIAPRRDLAAGRLEFGAGGALAGTAGGGAEGDDVALILHTSGTTSRPKMIPLSHSNVCASAHHIRSSLRLMPADRCLNVMPLFHIHGLIAGLLAPLAAGGSVICTPGFSANHFFQWLDELRPTWYTAVPAMHQKVLAAAEQNRDVIAQRQLRFIRSCSAALAPQVMSDLERTFGVPVIEAYGMTEAAHQIASNPLPPGLRKAGSVGLPTGPEISILDEAGRTKPQGEIGEIAIRGPNVSSLGVTGAGHGSAGSWFRTGDLGFFDRDGYVFIWGRLKEVVNRGGEKVSPREVDEALLEHHGVEQAAAFAAPHPTLGEDLLAAVVRRPGAEIDGAILRTFLLEKLSAFKVPSQILLVDEIPKGPTGKVQRHRLHELLGHLAHRPFVAPRDGVESQLAEIWKSLLNRSDVGIDDDFFALGGDSLLAVSAFVDIEARFGRALRLATLFDAPTIRQLAKVITSDDGPASVSTLVAVSTKGKFPPLFFMSGWGAQILVFADLARCLGNEQPLYAIDPTVIEVGAGETVTVEQVAARIIEDMRRAQPTGPYNLAGFSMGGKFVWEIAQQLDRAGERVSLLALLDTPAPGFPVLRPFLVRTALHLRHALALQPAEALAYLRERVLALRKYFLAPKKRTLFNDGDNIKASALAQRLERTANVMHEASQRYVPSVYKGQMVLVRAAHQPIQPEVDDTDPLMGWGPLATGGVAVRTLNCRHMEMLDAAHAPQLAEILSGCIRSLAAQTENELATGPGIACALDRGVRQDLLAPVAKPAVGGSCG